MRILMMAVLMGAWLVGDASAVVNEIHFTYGGPIESSYSCDDPWEDSGVEGRIARMDSDGGNRADVFNKLTRPTGIDCLGEQLYWTQNDEDGETAELLRANLGSPIIEPLTDLYDLGIAEPQGIALDPTNGRIYLTDLEEELAQGNLDGSGIDFITFDEDDTWDVAVDREGGHVYWTTWFSSGQEIWRANLDGSNEQILIDRDDDPETDAGPRGIALDLVNGKIYWTEFDDDDATECQQGSIWRADLDGENIEKLLDTGGAPNDIEIDVDDQRIYWTDTYQGTVESANADGSDRMKLASDLARVAYLVLDCQEPAPPVEEEPPGLPANSPWGLALLVLFFAGASFVALRARGNA